MSVKNVLKGIGKRMDDIFPKSGSIKYRGPKEIFQHTGDIPDSLYQSVIPWHISHKYTVPLVGAGTVGAIGVTSFKAHNQAKLGYIHAGEGLSGMTEGALDGVSANVITPGLKQLNDGSTKRSRAMSASIADNMEYNIGNSGAEGDIVFALHNMR